MSHSSGGEGFSQKEAYTNAVDGVLHLAEALVSQRRGARASAAQRAVVSACKGLRVAGGSLACPSNPSPGVPNLPGYRYLRDAAARPRPHLRRLQVPDRLPVHPQPRVEASERPQAPLHAGLRAGALRFWGYLPTPHLLSCTRPAPTRTRSALACLSPSRGRPRRASATMRARTRTTRSPRTPSRPTPTPRSRCGGECFPLQPVPALRPSRIPTSPSLTYPNLTADRNVLPPCRRSFCLHHPDW